MLKKPGHVGHIVKQLIKENNTSVAQVAKTIGAQPDTLQKVLDGNREMKPLVAIKLATLFGKRPDHFIQIHIARLVRENLRNHHRELREINGVAYGDKVVRKTTSQKKNTVIRRKNSDKV